MRGMIAIAMREMHDRRMVLAAALVAGVVPFVMPLVPGVRPDDAGPAIDVAAVILALGLGGILAAALGATAIGRDLANRRLAFDLARPVSELAVWAARLGAAAFLAAAAMIVVVGPALAVGALRGGFRLPDDAPVSWTLAVAAAVLLLIVPLAHVIGVVVRSRSGWLAVDAVAAAIVAVLAVVAVRRLVAVYAVPSAVILAICGAVAAIPVLWLATAVQVTRGRCDLRAGHRAQSFALWPLLALVALGMNVWAGRFVAVDPLELRWIDVHGASDGDWVAVSGAVVGHEDYWPMFLLEPGTGRSIRLGAWRPPVDRLLLAADGSRAVALQQEFAAGGGVAARIVDLGGPDARVRESTVRFSDTFSPFEADLSPSGRRLAGVQDRTLAVNDLDDGRLLASVRLPADFEGGFNALTFRGEGAVRLYRYGEDGVTAVELDIASRQLRRIGDEDSDGGAVAGQWIHWTPAQERVMLIDGQGMRVTMLGGDDLEPLWRLPDLPEDARRSANFLHDGRVVDVTVRGDAPPTVTIHDPDGAVLGRVEIDAPADYPAIGHEIDRGRFLLGLAARDASGGWAERRLYIVDADAGDATRIEGVTAIPFLFWWNVGGPPPEPGSARALVLAGDSCDAVLLDPESLTTRRIAGGTCPSVARGGADAGG